MVKPASLILLLLFFFPSPARAVREQDFFNQVRQKVLPFYRTCEQAFFCSSDNKKIAYLKHLSKNRETAIILLPGKSESYIKYAELMYDLNAPGVSFFVLDHRGMGFSERSLNDRDKVHAERFEDYVTDLKSFMETVVFPQKFRNRFILAHSMGGTVAIRYLETAAPDINGVILCSPMLGINTRFLPEPAAVLLTKIMVSLGKGKNYCITQGKRKPHKFKNNPLTASRNRWHLWQEITLKQYPETATGGATYQWVYESLMAGRQALKDCWKIKTPLLVLKAEKDAVVTAGAIDALCKKTAGEMVSFPDAGHEILMETDPVRDNALERIKQFMKACQQ